MFLTVIDLETADISTVYTFYTQTLGLPLRHSGEDAFTVQVGTTTLTFRASSQRPLHYHFAFTIPLNTWQEAKAWLKARTTLLEGEGAEEFESERVRTRSYYFPDPAGNILEFIARQDLPGTAGKDFGPEDILHNWPAWPGKEFSALPPIVFAGGIRASVSRALRARNPVAAPGALGASGHASARG